MPTSSKYLFHTSPCNVVWTSDRCLSENDILCIQNYSECILLNCSFSEVCGMMPIFVGYWRILLELLERIAQFLFKREAKQGCVVVALWLRWGWDCVVFSLSTASLPPIFKAQHALCCGLANLTCFVSTFLLSSWLTLSEPMEVRQTLRMHVAESFLDFENDFQHR